MRRPTEPRWRLRPPQAADAPALQRLEAACFGEPWSLGLLREVLSDPKYLLLCAENLDAADGEDLLGYAAAWSVLDEGQIDRLAVLPRLRRRGIGRALLGGIVELLGGAGAASVFLEVRAGNVGAIELYRAEGFATAGRRQGYYADGEDAVVLRLGVEGAST